MNNCTRPRVNIAQSSNYIIAPVSVCNQDNGIENEAIGNNTPNPFPLYSLGNLRLGGAGGSACLDSRIPRHLGRRRALTYSRGCDAIVGDVELLGGKLCNRRNKHESDQSRFMGRSGAGEEGQRVGRWPGREVEVWWGSPCQGLDDCFEVRCPVGQYVQYRLVIVQITSD